ncbi:MFS transporter [Nitrobacter sp. JJSN]|uniref:MFS transporter n=1 Tax=Nitrobacter sp. JJSN TaxID=3453033 RepID=UPI003F77143F
MATIEESVRRSWRGSGWRTPLVIIICGCLIGMLTFGPRSAFGFFMQPMSSEFSWGRDVFALAFAVQNLLWGIGQPFAGAIADRFGSVRVICVGALMYATGLLVMRYANTPLSLNIGAGFLIGFGLSGCSFNLVLSAFGKLLPEQWRGLALGAGTAAGSFGQFVFAPVSVALIDNFGWQPALTVFAVLMLFVVPLALVLSTPPGDAGSTAVAESEQSFKSALAEAFGHRSYVLLVLGFFTCGFQLAFITAHLPAYLVDRGLSVQAGGWVLAAIGLFNIIGSLSAGWLSTRMPKRYILSVIYFIRALSIVAFISTPMTTFSAVAFGVVTGLTWLSTIPPTTSLVALMFGTRWLATLYGFAFFSHQVGGFLGALLGGVVFDHFGSYTPVWWLSVLFGVLSALINLPIIEAPVRRAVAQPA